MTEARPIDKLVRRHPEDALAVEISCGDNTSVRQSKLAATIANSQLMIWNIPYSDRSRLEFTVRKNMDKETAIARPLPICQPRTEERLWSNTGNNNIKTPTLTPQATSFPLGLSKGSKSRAPIAIQESPSINTFVGGLRKKTNTKGVNSKRIEATSMVKAVTKRPKA